MSISSRVALVSGSTYGIGRAIVKRFVDDGYIVIQNSRSSIEDSEIIGEKHFPADVTKYSECECLIDAVVRDFGRIDVLVCNVGSGKDMGVGVSPTERWDHYLKVNLLSASNLIEAAIKPLKEAKGCVTAISSICGHSTVTGAPVEYSVAKGALNRYMKCMAVMHGKDGVRFNVVAPGNVFFRGSTWDSKMKEDSDAVKRYIAENVPLGGFVEPEEIANAVAFLSSMQSRFTTGAVLTIDGGQSV